MKFIDRTRETASLQTIQKQSLEHSQFTQIDNWWSRNGEAEIDIIAINELTKQAVFCEVKRKAKELDSSALEAHASEFLIATRQLKKYTIHHQGLSMQDM